MTIVLNNITDETIGIIKWQGSISLILIGILVICGSIGLVIKAMFVRFIAYNSSKDRPINLLIVIDQVQLSEVSFISHSIFTKFLVNFELLWILGAIVKQYQVKNHEMNKYVPLIKVWDKKASKNPKNIEIYSS